MWMTRSVLAATAGSWVTMTVVCPRSRLKPPEHRKDLGRARRIEVAGRLVREQQRRRVDQRPCQGDALLLAAGELHGPVVRPFGEPDHVERFQRRASAPYAALPRVVGREQHVLDARSASGRG